MHRLLQASSDLEIAVCGEGAEGFLLSGRQSSLGGLIAVASLQGSSHPSHANDQRGKGFRACATLVFC